MNKLFIVAAFSLLMISPVHAETTILEKKVELRQESHDKKVEIRNEVKKEVNNTIKNETKDLRAVEKTLGKIINGTVTAKGDNSLTVSIADNKTMTVQVSANTKIIRRFWGTSVFADIAVGNKVSVWGTLKDENTIEARIIRDLSIMKRHGVFFGDVVSKTDTQIVISTPGRDNQTVSISSSTKLTNKKEQTISLSDIAVGNKLRVKGMWDKSNNTITQTEYVKDFSL